MNIFEGPNHSGGKKKGWLSLGIGMVLFLWSFSVHAQDVSKTSREQMNRIKYRQLFMTTKANHTQALKLLINKQVNIRSHIAYHASILSGMADTMLSLFLKGGWDPHSRAKKKYMD